jgi:hypothetical protein
MLGSVVQKISIEKPARIKIGFGKQGGVSIDFIAEDFYVKVWR